MRDTWNMTPDEARKYILQNWFDGDENVNSFVCGDKEYTAMAIAVEALEATRWHYPSTGEYPTEGEKVLILYKDDDGVLDTCLGDYSYCEPAEDESFKADFYWNKENLDPLDDRQVECWQYIIPPKEEA